MNSPVAVITGASQGLGPPSPPSSPPVAGLVLDARRGDRLTAAPRRCPVGRTRAVAGDVADPAHRRELVDVAAELGGARLLVNNASTLGASPLPSFADLDPATYAPAAGGQPGRAARAHRRLLPQLRRHAGRRPRHQLGRVGGGLRDLGRLRLGEGRPRPRLPVLAAEEPRLRVYAVDPGDMRTQMHQDAFPGEDISDRPEPARRRPGAARAGRGRPARRRYRASDLAARCPA